MGVRRGGRGKRRKRRDEMQEGITKKQSKDIKGERKMRRKEGQEDEGEMESEGKDQR